MIGPRVSETREAKGWTQAQLAAKLSERGWNCTTEDVSEIESGLAPVSDAQFHVLGHVLEVEHRDLFPSRLAKKLPRPRKSDLT